MKPFVLPENQAGVGAPVSIPMLKEYKEQIDVKKMLSEEKILGNEHFSEAFVSKYVKENIFDINPKLL